MYTSGLKAKSTARKQDLGLTVSKATSQARRIADRIMPNAGVTVESRTSWDPTTDVATVVTTVTYPRTWAYQTLGEALGALPHVIDSVWADSSIVITRAA